MLASAIDDFALSLTSAREPFERRVLLGVISILNNPIRGLLGPEQPQSLDLHWAWGQGLDAGRGVRVILVLSLMVPASFGNSQVCK
jgi:hypothetical protein